MTRTQTIAQESGATQVRYEADGLQVELAPDHAVQIPLSPPAEREKPALLRRLLEHT
ncbi:hypothetical protein [Paenibacillus rubinfantis]|uniref:hypothetical protein n=1 Tax=Paenibacillus rubinfantis TaxID=1720296 RepID=UPI000AB874CB|nr:hypothetical protein [Paenibacillus rubinfantis]